MILIISLYSQTKDVKIWVENNHQDETIKVYFDALYSSAVGIPLVDPEVLTAVQLSQ